MVKSLMTSPKGGLKSQRLQGQTSPSASRVNTSLVNQSFLEKIDGIHNNKVNNTHRNGSSMLSTKNKSIKRRRNQISARGLDTDMMRSMDVSSLSKNQAILVEDPQPRSGSMAHQANRSPKGEYHMPDSNANSQRWLKEGGGPKWRRNEKVSKSIHL